MKLFITMIFFLLQVSFLFAQKGNAEQKTAISKLRWMTGTWLGTSTVKTDGQTRLTNIRETVQPALDGTILQITVWATDKDTGTRLQSLAYTSFSVISYDIRKKEYRWTTWRNNGNDYDQTGFSVSDDSFEYISHENGGQVRYKANAGSNGEFLETGEYLKNETEWEEFISMKLVKARR